MYDATPGEIFAFKGTIDDGAGGDGGFIFCAVHKEKKPLYLIVTCSTTLPGPTRSFTVYTLDNDGKETSFVAHYTSSLAHYLYRVHFNAVDLHNRARQGDNPVSEIWLTHS